MGGKRAQKRFSSIGKKEQLKGLPSMYSFMFFKCGSSKPSTAVASNLINSRQWLTMNDDRQISNQFSVFVVYKIGHLIQLNFQYLIGKGLEPVAAYLNIPEIIRVGKVKKIKMFPIYNSGDECFLSLSRFFCNHWTCKQQAFHYFRVL